MKRLILLLVLLLIVSCTTPEGSFEEIEQTVDEEIAKGEETIQDLEEVEEEQIEEEPLEEITEEGLVLHLTLDGEVDGTNNGAEFVEGKIGEALYFDGSDYVKLNSNSIGSLSEGTIMMWFKFESILDSQTVMPLLYLGGDENEEDNIYIIEVGHFAEGGSGLDPDPDNTKLYSTWIRDNNEPYLCYDSKENLNENEWYHFAVVVDSNGNTGYLNGEEITNRNYNFGSSSDVSFLSDISNQKKFFLGYGRSSYMLSPNFLHYKGYIDDVRVYDRALTSDEISELI